MLTWRTLFAMWGMVAAAAALQSLSGFGFALMVMPLAVMLLGLRTAAPLVALFGFTLYVINISRQIVHVRWKDLFPLALGGVLGVPVGVYTLTVVNETIINVALGAVLAAYAAYNLYRPEWRLALPGWAVYVAGFLGGCLGGAYNTSGPPVILYGRVSGWPREEFRSTLQGFFLLSSAVIIFSHYVAHNLTRTVLVLYGATLPALLAGVVFATRVDRRLDTRAFQTLVNGLLLILGFSLMSKGL